jgi:hypothetical protein
MLTGARSAKASLYITNILGGLGGRGQGDGAAAGDEGQAVKRRSDVSGNARFVSVRAQIWCHGLRKFGVMGGLMSAPRVERLAQT